MNDYNRLNRDDRRREADRIATKMVELFRLPMGMMCDAIVNQYNVLESKWKLLTGYNIE